jgi:16S rRNA (adenine1518-N6/adenine1519-N6)-dimethyltransferase
MPTDTPPKIPNMLPRLRQIDVHGLLRDHGLRPDKRLGQNFLSDNNILASIAEAAEIDSQEDVLEVGPGLGSLTRHLAQSARKVTAVELDHQLIPILQEVLARYPNVKIVQGDILQLDPMQLVERSGYLVVANIPYYITSALIRHLLEASLRPGRMVLTMQKEVAARICARPGDLSQLALSVQVYGRPRVVSHIPAGAFYPPPKVDSSVLRVDLYPTPVIPLELLGTFFRLMKAGFSQKRKMLRNTFSASLHISPPQAAELLQGAGIDPQRRAETLDLEEWGRLSERFHQDSIPGLAGLDAQPPSETAE